MNKGTSYIALLTNLSKDFIAKVEACGLSYELLKAMHCYFTKKKNK